MTVAVFAARGAALSLVLLIYYFASCGPAQGGEVRRDCARERAFSGGSACFACVRILIISTHLSRESLGLGPRMGIMAWCW